MHEHRSNQAPHPVAPPAGNLGSNYLTRAEAARYLNVPSTWLANNAKRGPRYIKVGGLVRYSVDSLDAYMSVNERRGS